MRRASSAVRRPVRTASDRPIPGIALGSHGSHGSHDILPWWSIYTLTLVIPRAHPRRMAVLLRLAVRAPALRSAQQHLLGRPPMSCWSCQPPPELPTTTTTVRPQPQPRPRLRPRHRHLAPRPRWTMGCATAMVAQEESREGEGGPTSVAAGPAARASPRGL